MIHTWLKFANMLTRALCWSNWWNMEIQSRNKCGLSKKHQKRVEKNSTSNFPHPANHLHPPQSTILPPQSPRTPVPLGNDTCSCLSLPRYFWFLLCDYDASCFRVSVRQVVLPQKSVRSEGVTESGITTLLM